MSNFEYKYNKCANELADAKARIAELEETERHYADCLKEERELRAKIVGLESAIENMRTVFSESSKEMREEVAADREISRKLYQALKEMMDETRIADWLQMDCHGQVKDAIAEYEGKHEDASSDMFTGYTEEVSKMLWNPRNKPESVEPKGSVICPHCKVDRTKQPCPNLQQCKFIGEAYTATPLTQAAVSAVLIKAAGCCDGYDMIEEDDPYWNKEPESCERINAIASAVREVKKEILALPYNDSHLRDLMEEAMGEVLKLHCDDYVDVTRIINNVLERGRSDE